MNVNLTPELDRIVREKVKSGMYGSASEVVREALRRMLKDEMGGVTEVAEGPKRDYGSSTHRDRLKETMERIWADQRERGHVPPTKEEVDQHIRELREGWDR